MLLSTAYASTAVASARMSLIVRFCLPRWTALSRFGIAIAARMPMIAMTIKQLDQGKTSSRFFIVPPSVPLLLHSKFRLCHLFARVKPHWVPDNRFKNQ